MSEIHIPVLKDEIVEFFSDMEGGVIVDATLGYAGHTSAILSSNEKVAIVGIDRDKTAIEYSRKKLLPFKNRVEIVEGRFSQKIADLLDRFDVKGVLADLGVSSLQLDDRSRGFSFESDTLDMRMDSQGISAYEVVNGYPLEELIRIFKEYGEIKEAKKLAEKIVSRRSKAPIVSGKELSSLAAETIFKRGKTNPATKLFQAIRIEVNQELKELETLLDILEDKRPLGAKIAIITFHSLEDRIVKERFKKWSRECICPPEALRCVCQKNNSLGKRITKKPIVPSAKEIELNPRSRSAKLRLFQFKEGK